MLENCNRVTMSQENSVMLERNTLPRRVLNILMDWIMDGKLKMDDKLNTEELARQLGVSRMPIREALNSLEKMGLAESIPYIGTRLVTLTKDDVVEIYMMRQMLEPLVAGVSCEKITKNDIEELESIHSTYVEIVSASHINAKDVHLQNRRFHFKIYSISGMNRVCSVIESLWDTLSFFKLIYGREFINNNKKVKNMITEHRSYIDALEIRDSEALKKYLYDSLGNRILNISKNKDYYNIDSDL